jgi:hypothetical protein
MEGGWALSAPFAMSVIPAQAGISLLLSALSPEGREMPAFAGMTEVFHD